jgi:hypothetical protein
LGASIILLLPSFWGTNFTSRIGEDGLTPCNPVLYAHAESGRFRKKTCRRLGVNFWEYLRDRVGGLGTIPRLADLIRQKAEEIAARKAQAAPAGPDVAAV